MITTNHIIQSINICNVGNLTFNNGANLYCFLFESTWYPLKTIINHASVLAFENQEYTTNTALVKMHELFEYVKVKQLAVQNNVLVHLTNEEKLDDINCLATMISKLSN
jgi:hypothetical protein